MSILDRLNLLIRSNINDSIGRHGRSSSARQALSEMEGSLRDARRQQAELRRGERQLAEQIRQARQRADQWEDRAMLALRRGDEELAREALVVKNQAMAEAQRHRDQLDDHRAYIKDIERALEALEMKLEGTRSKIRAVSGRYPASSGSSARRELPDQDRARQADWDAEFARRQRDRHSVDVERRDDLDLEHPTTAFDTSASFREMDRMAGKIDSMEAEIEAMRELGGAGGDGRREELDRIFRSMEDRRSSTRDDRTRTNTPPLDDDLAELKKKFQ